MKALAVLISIGMIFMLLGCASTSIPQGAQQTGLYLGEFRGFDVAGASRVVLFKQADGSEGFAGKFSYDSSKQVNLSRELFGTESTTVGFKGQIAGNELTGAFFGPISGTVTGAFSEDRKKIEGSYVVSAPVRGNGVWEAQIKD